MPRPKKSSLIGESYVVLGVRPNGSFATSPELATRLTRLHRRLNAPDRIGATATAAVATAAISIAPSSAQAK